MAHYMIQILYAVTNCIHIEKYVGSGTVLSVARAAALHVSGIGVSPRRSLVSVWRNARQAWRFGCGRILKSPISNYAFMGGGPIRGEVRKRRS